MLEDVFTSEVTERVIPELGVLDRCSLARVNKFLKKIVYNPIWWRKLNLKYIRTDFNSPPSFRSISGGPDAVIYSVVKPPAEIALQRVLMSLFPNKARFAETTSVNFKNFMLSDTTIQLATKIFPSIERLDLDGGKISILGMQLLKDFKKLRFLTINCSDQVRWDSKLWLASLEFHLETLQMSVKGGEFDSLFLKKCVNCPFYYNPKFNTSKSCLYHTLCQKEYGCMCQSLEFTCCSSSIVITYGKPPDYRFYGNCIGCTYGFHCDEGKAIHDWDIEWFPELLTVDYSIKFDCMMRYRRRDC